MKTKILIAAAALAAFAAPARASAPTDNMFSNPANGQAVQPEQSAGDIYGDVFRSPFEDRARQAQTGLRPLGGQGGNNLFPLRMDANGVPNLRL